MATLGTHNVPERFLIHDGKTGRVTGHHRVGPFLFHRVTFDDGASLLLDADRGALQALEARPPADDRPTEEQ